MDYKDFCLKIEPPRDGIYPVTVIESPAGGGRGCFELPLTPGQIRELRQGACRSFAIGTGEAPREEEGASPAEETQ